ncbi:MULTISPECIES: hypothetical protein [Streptomyces]|uniref:Uncharacterized protein n=1 Tax=Streptomyces glycanivorans TaxID=3033808 RepID=A0ABY9J5D0_9ACTN|nr:MULTISPECIES: hypothetical protein [unclassified Streptomyces]WSQ75902.1 hypothetical protein OG725_01890 [Streptomyces sp. NBC_01213]WLQ62395.1 hypothetical protein P8A20_01785 [Streptomyces sp. Alt3]WSQ83149.1 hypothetical protein OG722_01830 [Streptomyces sp. NBC_01212]WSR10821.1 hypothetical protein OG265_34480 [Streptomyces sp. NBC_01208]WSR46483.1 hypothetical protein OG279_02175 [Streptomyces sp. NBC_01201]
MDGVPVEPADAEFLMSPEARDAATREGVPVIDHRALRRVWTRSAGQR